MNFKFSPVFKYYYIIVLHLTTFDNESSPSESQTKENSLFYTLDYSKTQGSHEIKKKTLGGTVKASSMGSSVWIYCKQRRKEVACKM